MKNKKKYNAHKYQRCYYIKKEIKTFPCRRRQISFHLVFKFVVCNFFFPKKKLRIFLLLGHQEDRQAQILEILF